MTQTILGAGGQIADELARSLRRDHFNQVDRVRLVSRTPRAVNPDHEGRADELVTADLTDAEATDAAVAGSEVVYLTVGLPMNSSLWEQRFPTMLANTIAACQRHSAKLVFFDNTYMYPRTDEVQTEHMVFAPRGRKAVVRAQLATTVLAEMAAGRIEAVIARAPEFYGPGKTQSLTNRLVFDRIKAGQRPLVPVKADTRRSLIYTPDASRAMALLGNSEDVWGRTWHLPIDQARPSYRELIAAASQIVRRPIRFSTLPMAAFTLGGWVNEQMKEAAELMPRYQHNNLFDSSAFAQRFPEFTVTPYLDGVAATVQEG